MFNKLIIELLSIQLSGSHLVWVSMYQPPLVIKELNKIQCITLYCYSECSVFIFLPDPVSGVNIVLDKAGEDFEFGDSLTLKCSVERGSSPTFLWMHNGKVVKKSFRVYQLRDNGKVLYIYSLRYYHSGSYQCSVSNKVSNRTFSVISDIQKINVLQQSPVKESTFTVDDDDPPERKSFLPTIANILIDLNFNNFFFWHNNLFKDTF